MWGKIKGWLAVVGAVAIAVAGYLLGRNSSNAQGADFPSTRERAERVVGDIGQAGRDNREATGLADNAARDNREATEYADSAADDNKRARDIIQRIRERGTVSKDNTGGA